MSHAQVAIQELIVVSQDALGQPHVAPFGVRFESDRVHIAPYRPSKTLDNLLHSKSATLNFSDDVRVFAGALTQHPCWQLRQIGPAWVLDSALAYQQVRLDSVQDDALRPNLYCRIEEQQSLAMFRGFNRAQYAVIELCVLFSRIHLLPFQQIIQAMQAMQSLIDKTAGDREREAWAWLQQAIQQHQEQHDTRLS